MQRARVESDGLLVTRDGFCERSLALQCQAAIIVDGREPGRQFDRAIVVREGSFQFS